MNTIKHLSLFVLLLFIHSYSGIAQKSLFYENQTSDNYINELIINVPKANRKIAKEALRYQFATLVEPKYAVNIPVSETREDDGYYHYLVHILANEAYSINFSLSGLYTAQVNQVNILNLKTNKVIGSLVPINNKLDIEPFPIINNKECILELISKKIFHENSVIISRIGVQFKNSKKSGVCEVDINCEEGNDWQNEKQSVVKLTINNIYLCTGTLLNNLAKDKKPYILTANHCIGNLSEAHLTVAYFNYESPICDGGDGIKTHFMRFAHLKATKYDSEGKLDFSLICMYDTIPENFHAFYAGWDANGDIPQNCAGIHHPYGDVKKICKDYDQTVSATYTDINDTYDDNAHWEIIKWDIGVTEGGSSGSALFNSSHLVVGDLTGGEATCDFPYHDYYAKFSKSFDKYPDSTQQLKYWLDPNNTGQLLLQSLGVDTVYKFESLKVAPNPTSNTVTIFSEIPENNIVRLLSLDGKILYQTSLSACHYSTILRLPSDIKGLYILKIQTQGKTKTTKIVIN